MKKNKIKNMEKKTKNVHIINFEKIFVFSVYLYEVTISYTRNETKNTNKNK